MRSALYSSKGFIINKRKLGESDLIITLFTQELGKISTVAKSARTIKSKKRAFLELGNLIHFQAVKTKSLDILTEVKLLDQITSLKKDLKKISLVYFFLEAINKLTPEGEQNPSVFDILQGALSKTKTGKNLKTIRMDFVENLLVNLGFWPKGMKLANPDLFLSQVSERQFSSIRIGKKLLS